MAKTAEYGIGDFTYPRGWLMVAASASVTTIPSEARFFGEDVVLYRGTSGRPVMLEAYCPHMGAHLAVGASGATALHGVQVEGDMIRCPNHGWRFGPDGRCNQIPYSTMSIPQTLGIKAWQLEERAGCIFAWHDPEGGDPTYDLPLFQEWDDPRWIRWTIDELEEMDVHQLELAEHGVDKIHNANVHGQDRLISHRVSFDEHRAQTSSTSVQFGPDGQPGAPMTIHSRYTGPALLLAEVESEQPALFFFAHTPVEDGKIRGWHGVALQARGERPDDDDFTTYQELRKLSLSQFNQDMEIFKRKRPTLKVVQVPGDGPFRRYRQWYSQFYMPRAQTKAIQAGANGVIETDGDYDAPWISAVTTESRKNSRQTQEMKEL